MLQELLHATNAPLTEPSAKVLLTVLIVLVVASQVIARIVSKGDTDYVREAGIGKIAFPRPTRIVD